jgi:hypothetical protein
VIESTMIARHGGAKYSYSRNSGRAEITVTKRAGKGAAMHKFSEAIILITYCPFLHLCWNGIDYLTKRESK